MTKAKLNKRRIFKFMYIISVLAVGAVLENGDITSALIFAAFI